MSNYHPMVVNGKRWLVRQGRESLFERPLRNLGVIKHGTYKTSELWEFNGRSFLAKTYRRRSLFSPNLARREFRGATAADERGVPTLELFAARLTSTGGTLVYPFIPDYTTLDQVLKRPLPFRERCALIRKYSAFCRKVHDAGIVQDDFNPTNALYHTASFWLVDFERVEVKSRITQRARIANLAGLNRFPHASRTERLCFLKAYLGHTPWKPFAREILKRYMTKVQATVSKIAASCLRESRNYGIQQIGPYTVYFSKELVHRQALDSWATTGFKGVATQIVADARQSWQDAVVKAYLGGPRPLACFVKLPEPSGIIVYAGE